jgi:hypothetical protein
MPQQIKPPSCTGGSLPANKPTTEIPAHPFNLAIGEMCIYDYCCGKRAARGGGVPIALQESRSHTPQRPIKIGR